MTNKRITKTLAPKKLAATEKRRSIASAYVIDAVDRIVASGDQGVLTVALANNFEFHKWPAGALRAVFATMMVHAPESDLDELVALFSDQACKTAKLVAEMNAEDAAAKALKS